MSKIKPGTVEKNSSIIGPLAGIEPTCMKPRQSNPSVCFTLELKPPECKDIYKSFTG